MAFSRDGDRVTLTITLDQYNMLIFTAGYAAGAAKEDNDLDLFRGFLRFANAINEGNPNWTPYEESEPAQK